MRFPLRQGHRMSWYHELPLLIVAFHDSCEKVADIIMVAVPERRYLPPEADETRFISRQVHKFEAVELGVQGDLFSLWVVEDQYWLDDIMSMSESIVGQKMPSRPWHNLRSSARVLDPLGPHPARCHERCHLWET